ncbi:hypothetical protein J23TS9_06390 [Paenibacillus sp. J23TS9]|uniref:hypothetical protein n=1 Tax=Paenibacillus sp. J23TS9 TaxID=2807193 RepID=UPI001B172FE3|nr:hypothetical protein [Paenibacillus sp. J23TS9]GIP25509.1 hypothetical protein J23TS9_06390 [Paenibacillus sp. J23TS9]
MSTKTRKDLIGLKGTVTRQIEVMDAQQHEDGTVDILVSDNMGNTYWTGMDGEIDLDS